METYLTVETCLTIETFTDQCGHGDFHVMKLIKLWRLEDFDGILTRKELYNLKSLIPRFRIIS